jgi:hypothetical protein
MICPKKYFFILLFLSVFFSIFSQTLGPRDRYWTAGFNLGTIGWSPARLENISGNNAFQRTLNYGLGDVVDVNGHKQLAFLANTSVGLNAGFIWRDKHNPGYTCIQAEVQNNKACYEFNSPFAMPSHGDSTTKWVETDKYLKYSLAIQRCWYRGDNSWLGGSEYWYIRESFGQTLFHRNFNDLIKVNHSEDWTENGTGMQSKILSLSPSSYMIGTEIGIKSFSSDKLHSLDLGLVYYAPFTNTFTEQYEFFKNKTLVGKSNITYNGGSLMLNLRYTFNYKLKDKPVDSVKVKKTDPLVHSHKVNGRNVEVQNKMEVGTDLVTVKVWDRGTVDGDKIALYLNGELILDDYTLNKDKKEITLHLQAGTNYLAMHAINLGTIPPNTAAMEISDGKKKKNITVISDTGKSGAIEIIYTP